MLDAATGVPGFAVQDAAAFCAGSITCAYANQLAVRKLPGEVVTATSVHCLEQHALMRLNLQHALMQCCKEALSYSLTTPEVI